MAAGLEESGNFGAKFCRRSFQMKSCYLWLLAGCLMLMHRAEGSFAIASKMGLQQNLETFGENRVLDIVPHFLEDTGHPLLHSGAKSRSARNVHGYSSPQHGRKSRPAQVYIFNAFSRQAQLSVSLITASGPKKVLASKIEYGLSRLVHLETLSIYDAFHVEVSRRRHKAAPGKSAIKIIGKKAYLMCLSQMLFMEYTSNLVVGHKNTQNTECRSGQRLADLHHSFTKAVSS